MTDAVWYVLGGCIGDVAWHGAGGSIPSGKSGCGDGLSVGPVVVSLTPTESKVVESDVAEGRVVVCVTGLTGLLSFAVKLSTSVCVLSICDVRRQ